MCHERPTDEELVQWRELVTSKLEAERNEASERLKRNQEKSKAYFDRQVVPLSVAVGDFVMLKNECPKKFEVNWRGPYRVTAVHRENAALIKLESLEKEQLPNWINLDRVRALTKGRRIDNDGYSANYIGFPSSRPSSSSLQQVGMSHWGINTPGLK